MNPFLTAHDAQASLGNPLILNRVVGRAPSMLYFVRRLTVFRAQSDGLQCAV